MIGLDGYMMGVMLFYCLRRVWMALLLLNTSLFAVTNDDATVAALVDALRASNCELNDQNSWLDAKAAAGFISQRYEQWKSEGGEGAQQFFSEALYQDPISGQKYRIKCAESIRYSELWIAKTLEQIAH